MGLLQIDLLGTSFSIKSDEDTEYLNKLLKYYKGITDGIQKKGAFTNPLQIAIMAGIMMCDQVYSDKKKKVEIQEAIENNTFDDRIDKMIQAMNSKIDAVL